MVNLHKASSFNKWNRAQTGVKWSPELAKNRALCRKFKPSN